MENSRLTKLVNDLEEFKKKSLTETRKLHTQAKADKEKISDLQQCLNESKIALKSHQQIQQTVISDMTKQFMKEKQALSDENYLLMELYNTGDGPSLLLKKTTDTLKRKEEECLQTEKKYNHLQMSAHTQQLCVEQMFKKQLAKNHELTERLAYLEGENQIHVENYNTLNNESMDLLEDFKLLKKEVMVLKNDNQFLKNNKTILLEAAESNDFHLQKAIDNLNDTKLFLEDENKILQETEHSKDIELRQMKSEITVLEDICLKMKKKNRCIFSRKMGDRATELEKMKAKQKVETPCVFNRIFKVCRKAC